MDKIDAKCVYKMLPLPQECRPTKTLWFPDPGTVPIKASHPQRARLNCHSKSHLFSALRTPDFTFLCSSWDLADGLPGYKESHSISHTTCNRRKSTTSKLSEVTNSISTNVPKNTELGKQVIFSKKRTVIMCTGSKRTLEDRLWIGNDLFSKMERTGKSTYY